MAVFLLRVFFCGVEGSRYHIGAENYSRLEQQGWKPALG